MCLITRDIIAEIGKQLVPTLETMSYNSKIIFKEMINGRKNGKEKH